MDKTEYEKLPDIKVVDFLGREITSGSYIAYPFKECDSTKIRVGIVTDAFAFKSEWHDDPQFRITVLGLERNWDTEQLQPLKRKSTLMCPERTVVLCGCNISDQIKDLLAHA